MSDIGPSPKIDPGANVGHSSGILEWYVAYTRVRAEVKAAQGLGEAGFARFLPLVKRVISSSGAHARKAQYRPLFPRYVFFAIPVNRMAPMAILDVDGIERVLTVSGIWVRVPTAMLAPLMMEDAFGLRDEKEPLPAPRRRRRHTHKIRRQIQAIAQWLDANRRMQ
jgi:transcription antitermination factor NusG